MKHKLDKIREQSGEDLIKRISEIKESLFRLNFKKSLGDTDTVDLLTGVVTEFEKNAWFLRATLA